MKEENSLVLEGAKVAFNEVMLSGYAGGSTFDRKVKIKIRKTDSHTVLTGEVGDYTVIDEWYTALNSKHSFGTTTILFEGMGAIWRMAYTGAYLPEVIPVLKAALASAYREGKFIGGRGSVSFEHTIYVYENFPENFSFTDFQGEERILRASNHEVMGFHRYWGVALI